jgi:hypothetical protein
MRWESARGIPTGQQLLGDFPGNANELLLMKLSLFTSAKKAKLATKSCKGMESLDASHTETRILPFLLSAIDENLRKG